MPAARTLPGNSQNTVDMITIYRALREDLEDRDLITSRWDTSNAGLAHRVYQIAEEGNHYLAWWIDDLRETDWVLHHFLDTCDTHMEVHQQPAGSIGSAASGDGRWADG